MTEAVTIAPEPARFPQTRLGRGQVAPTAGMPPHDPALRVVSGIIVFVLPARDAPHPGLISISHYDTHKRMSVVIARLS